jgi:phytoene synthase
VSNDVSETITRQSGSNLALGFILLPPEKRAAMAALYAFCRQVDDVADEDAVPVDVRRGQLGEWRADISRACLGEAPQFPVNRELQPHIQHYRLPFTLFDELIRGVEMDLDQQRYPDWAALELYCYRVASVVGLLSIEVFEYRNSACRRYADTLGKALQLTNILRDVRNDALRGRIYLPGDEMRKFAVTENEILEGVWSERFEALCQSTADRAAAFYHEARTCLPREDRRAMIAAETMGSVYWRLLSKLKARRFQVMGSEPVRLPRYQKICLVLLSLCRVRWGLPLAAYGV